MSLALVLACAVHQAATAAQHTGQVTATDVPIPGAVVTATQGDTELVTSTDQQGGYTFPDLADGVWSIRVEMPGFSPLARDVTIADGSDPVTWELALLTFAEIARGRRGSLELASDDGA